MHKRLQSSTLSYPSPSVPEWALLLLALVVAALLRFWQLDQIPPGLYRDEAYNGLDALRVLDGELALFFAANNGREPLYIYLTALAVSVLGQTTLAVRMAAALVGSLTTIPVYFLGRSWFGGAAGLLAAWLWAITLWPVHLSRLGLRPILFVPLIALAFWLGTLAYRRGRPWLWAASGALYGLTFYTYLVARFTPLLLLSLLLYLVLTSRRRFWPGVFWFGAAAGLVLLPLFIAFVADPALVLGRAGQVSILHPDVNQGALLRALWRQTAAALGMFAWRGDTILRHNPAGRPVFDPFIVIPMVVGLVYLLRSWRRPPSAATLLWVLIMLGPTILAADAPHFLRAVGVLPAVLFLPAVGLRQIAGWVPLPGAGKAALAAMFLGLSLLLTVRDYTAYGREPAVAYAFERAASDLAAAINAEPPDADLRLDARFWSSWPSISFLVPDEDRVIQFGNGAAGPSPVEGRGAVYAWPYDDGLGAVERLLPPTAVVSPREGSLARSDHEDTAYPLYVRYGIDPPPATVTGPLAEFGGQLLLADVSVDAGDPRALQVDVYWTAQAPLQTELVTFVHVLGAAGMLGQDDHPPGAGYWPASWWQPGLTVRDSHTIVLSEPYDPAQHRIMLGLYEAATGERLPALTIPGGEALGDAWLVTID